MDDRWNQGIIENLEARIKELENEKLFWNCSIHGKSQNTWGCPECTRELRLRTKELEGGVIDVLNDEESRPGGWGPDVTAIGILIKLIEKTYKLENGKWVRR